MNKLHATQTVFAPLVLMPLLAASFGCGIIATPQPASTSPPATVAESEPTIEPTAAIAPKAGYWAGEPSVSLEVTDDGRIRNLVIESAPAPSVRCTIEVSSISVASDGTFTWINLIDEDEYWPSADRAGDLWPTPVTTDEGPKVEAQRITGQFGSATTLTGTYKILVCEDHEFFWAEGKGVVSWSAEWQRAGAQP